MSELYFKNRVIKMIRKEYPEAWFTKVNDATRSGVPDILGHLNGYFFAFELKTPTGRPTKIQMFNLSEIERRGGVGELASTYDHIRAVLNYLRGLPKHRGRTK